MDSEEGNAAGNDSKCAPTLSGEPKGSRPRRTFEEMACLRVNELESLKKLDVSSWSEKKKGKPCKKYRDFDSESCCKHN